MDAPQNPLLPREAAARRVLFGLGSREIGFGVIAFGILVGVGWLLNRQSRQREADSREIGRALEALSAVADDYRARFTALQKRAAAARRAASAEEAESNRRWLREQALRYDAVLAAVAREATARRFDAGAKEVASLVRHRAFAAANRRMAELEAPRFAPAAEFTRLIHDVYEVPLARFSRHEPELYRAFRQFEPEASRRDEAALRAEIAAAGGAVTPQVMAKVDLLAVVAATDDPVVAGWADRASALEFFEAPTPATVARWESARRAIRAEDWPAAVAQMQAILKSTARTRQPFRAALGRALLKCRPDQPGDAYGFMAEAAAAGDKQARAWVAEDDFRNHRYDAARRWLEAREADGEPAAVPLLLAVYEQAPDSGDPARMRGTLERITERPDAPAEALLLLGAWYERDDPGGGGAAKAYACFTRAAAKGSARAHVQVARCALRGAGTTHDPDAAREEACRAFALGEREAVAPILLELMRESPGPTAEAVARLFGEEAVAGGGGFVRSDVIDGPGVTELKTRVARYLDQSGALRDAARMYRGLRDPASGNRYAELTAGHPCETCGGGGKVLVSAPCPTCGGKGTQICGFCSGAGVVYAPGTPPCGSCGGSGAVIQDRKQVACAACGGTGYGRGSVVKQDCRHCDHGRVPCSECARGVIKVTKECPECHGRGTWALAERDAGS